MEDFVHSSGWKRKNEERGRKGEDGKVKDSKDFSKPLDTPLFIARPPAVFAFPRHQHNVTK